MSFSPVVRIYWSILIDGMISCICREKRVGNNIEKILLYLGVSIDSRNKGMSWIEFYYFFIFTDCISDVGSFYFSFSFDICRMHNIYDFYSLMRIFLYDFFCMTATVRSTSLGREEYYDIFFIWIVSIEDGYDIFFYNIVWLRIYRNDDNMFEAFSSFCDDCIFCPIRFFEFEEFDI